MPTASQVDPKSEAFEDADASAHAVLSGLGDDSQEQAGVILVSPDGRYHYTTPTTSHQHDNFEVRVALQKGWKIAGIYHTHPGKDDDGQVFSPQDLEMAAKLNVPSYIRFLKDGSIRKYIPGQTSTQNKPQGKFIRKVATGDTLPPPQVAQALSTPPVATPDALTNALK